MKTFRSFFALNFNFTKDYSTVTDLAKFLG